MKNSDTFASGGIMKFCELPQAKLAFSTEPKHLSFFPPKTNVHASFLLTTSVHWALEFLVQTAEILGRTLSDTLLSSSANSVDRAYSKVAVQVVL